MTFAKARAGMRVLVTLLLLATAAIAGLLLWTHYAGAAWTRDGQVLANVVDIAPEVEGRITRLLVADNQMVHRGDVLYQIDPIDYQVAVAAAEAGVNDRLAAMKLRQAQAARRSALTTLSTSQEELQTFQSGAEAAAAAYAGAQARLNQARIDQDRTSVRSPVNGYVTNLMLREGDYATRGTRNIAVIDSDSFWIAGFFEEPKLAGIHVGDPAAATLMGFADPVRGHVESIARGIDTPNTTPGALGLATVSTVFTWVRVSQRIPVRVHIDAVPDTVHLAAGMTATVSVGPEAALPTRRPLL